MKNKIVESVREDFFLAFYGFDGKKNTVWFILKSSQF